MNCSVVLMWIDYSPSFPFNTGTISLSIVFHGILKEGSSQTYTLENFSAWLQVKARAKSIAQQVSVHALAERSDPLPRSQRKGTPATMYLNTSTFGAELDPPAKSGKSIVLNGKGKF